MWCVGRSRRSPPASRHTISQAWEACPTPGIRALLCLAACTARSVGLSTFPPMKCTGRRRSVSTLVGTCSLPGWVLHQARPPHPCSCLLFFSLHSGLHEGSTLEPTNPYSAAKAGAEMMVKAYINSYKLPCIITRGNNVYGPHQFPEKLIPKFILRAARWGRGEADRPTAFAFRAGLEAVRREGFAQPARLFAGAKREGLGPLFLCDGAPPCPFLRGDTLPVHGDGLSVRSYLHVEDVAAAFDVVLHKGVVGEVYNIGTTKERTVLAVAKDICRHFKLPESNIIHVADR